MGQESRRRCVRCDFEPGYNREVVDLVRGEPIGSLCRQCECDVLEDQLETASPTSGSGCARCTRDGFYALPKWLPETTLSEGIVQTTVDYELDDDAIHLCDEHYQYVVDDVTSAPVDGLKSSYENR